MCARTFGHIAFKTIFFLFFHLGKKRTTRDESLNNTSLAIFKKFKYCFVLFFDILFYIFSADWDEFSKNLSE